MGIWCRCYGTIAMREGSRFSIKKSIEEFFDEVAVNCVTEHKNGLVFTTFSFVFSEEGRIAATMIETWVKEITKQPFYAYSQIESEIRFT